MPHSSKKQVYSRAEKARIVREKKSAGKVLGGVGGSLKAAFLMNQLSPAAKKKQIQLRQRAIEDRITGRGRGALKPPTQPSQPPGFIGGVKSGRDALLEALRGKKKGQR